MSSTKVRFSLESLKDRALSAIEERITAAEERASEANDRNKIRQAQLLWRERQEARLRETVEMLNETSDEDLVGFKVEPYPKFDEYEGKRALRDLDRLYEERNSIIAKAESLITDAEGNVSLTTTQLRDFFGLV